MSGQRGELADGLGVRGLVGVGGIHHGVGRAEGCDQPVPGHHSARPGSGVAGRDAGLDAGAAEQHHDVHVPDGVLGVDDRDAGRGLIHRRRVVRRVQRHVVAAQPNCQGRSARRRLHGRAVEHLAVSPPSSVDVLAHQSVAHSQERGHVLSGRPLEDPLWCVVLLDAAVAHHREAIAEREGFGLVVGHEHGGESQPGVQLMDLGAHSVAQASVEVAQRLVEQHQLRTSDQPPGQGDTLLLATAELRGVPVQQLPAIHQAGGLLHPTALHALLDLAGPQRISDVLAYRHVGPQGVGLEHHPGVPLVRREVHPLRRVEHRAVAEGDAPRAGRLQPGEATQRGGLPAPAGTEEDEELTLLDLQVEVIDRLGRGIAVVVLHQAFNGHTGHDVPRFFLEDGSGYLNSPSHSA